MPCTPVEPLAAALSCERLKRSSVFRPSFVAPLPSEESRVDPPLRPPSNMPGVRALSAREAEGAEFDGVRLLSDRDPDELGAEDGLPPPWLLDGGGDDGGLERFICACAAAGLSAKQAAPNAKRQRAAIEVKPTPGLNAKFI